MSDNTTILTTSLDGLFIIKRPTIGDERGFFREPVRIKELEAAMGTSFQVVQMNHARSKKNILRGIHIAPWNKLIYVTRGKVQAVMVDLREDSLTFGKHESFIIGDDNRSAIFIPKGFGNAYLVLSDETDYTYLTDEEWTPNKEYGVLWNDPDIAVKWEVSDNLITSERDNQAPSLKSLFPHKFQS